MLLSIFSGFPSQDFEVFVWPKQKNGEYLPKRALHKRNKPMFFSFLVWFFHTFDTSPTWNPKQPFINGCFNCLIPNLYIGNGCFTKHPFINGCLEFQEELQNDGFRIHQPFSWDFRGENFML